MRTLIVLASAVVGAFLCFLGWCLTGWVSVEGGGLHTFIMCAVASAITIGAAASWYLPRLHRPRGNAACDCTGIVGDCGHCTGACQRSAPLGSWGRPFAVLKAVIFLGWPAITAVLLLLMALLLCLVWIVIPFLSVDRRAAASGASGQTTSRTSAASCAGCPGATGADEEWKSTPAFSG